MATWRPFCCEFFVSLSYNSNVPESLLFKLGTKALHCGIHMHANLSAIRSNMAAWRPFCCDFFMSLSHNSNVPQPILFKLGTKALHCDIHMHANLFCNTIQYGRLAAILLRFFSCLLTIIQTCLNRFCSILVQALSTMAYICTSIYFTIRSYMAACQLFCCNFLMSLNHNSNVL